MIFFQQAVQWDDCARTRRNRRPNAGPQAGGTKWVSPRAPPPVGRPVDTDGTGY